MRSRPPLASPYRLHARVFVQISLGFVCFEINSFVIQQALCKAAGFGAIALHALARVHGFGCVHANQAHSVGAPLHSNFYRVAVNNLDYLCGGEAGRLNWSGADSRAAVGQAGGDGNGKRE